MPLPKKLDLRINHLAAKERWLMTLSAMLRDARVLGHCRWDVRRMCFEMDLERIGYESQVSSDGVFECPSIACRLSVMPVLGCVDGRDTLAGEWKAENMQAVELRDALELAMVTTSGTTRLHLCQGACLEIRDLGQPTEGPKVCNPGDPAIDLYRAGELLRTRVV